MQSENMYYMRNYKCHCSWTRRAIWLCLWLVEVKLLELRRLWNWKVFELYLITIKFARNKAENENVDVVLKLLRKVEEDLGSSVNDCIKGQQGTLSIWTGEKKKRVEWLHSDHLQGARNVQMPCSVNMDVWGAH